MNILHATKLLQELKTVKEMLLSLDTFNHVSLRLAIELVYPPTRITVKDPETNLETITIDESYINTVIREKGISMFGTGIGATYDSGYYFTHQVLAACIRDYEEIVKKHDPEIEY